MPRPRTSPVWQPEPDDFRALIASSATLTEALAAFGLSMRGHNYRTLIRRCQEEGVDIRHFQARKGKQRVPPKPLQDVLIVGVHAIPMARLKQRLLREGCLVNLCAICGLGPEWNGAPLALQLDHRNGNARDNRLENLRLLCPNCHSQTETFAGKRTAETKAARRTEPCASCGQPKASGNAGQVCLRCRGRASRKAERPDPATLREQIARLGYRGAGRLHGVSDNAIRKWLRATETL